MGRRDGGAIDGEVLRPQLGTTTKCDETAARLGDSLDREMQGEEAEPAVVFDLLLVAGDEDSDGAQWKLHTTATRV